MSHRNSRKSEDDQASAAMLKSKVRDLETEVSKLKQVGVEKLEFDIGVGSV